MALSKLPAAAMEQTMRLLGTGAAADLAIRQAAWVARCVGRGEAAPLGPADVDALAATLPPADRPAVAVQRRWETRDQPEPHRRLAGPSLTEQVARLLLEAVDGDVPLPQRTLAAMLGVQRPSLNEILKEFERASLIEVRYAAIHLVDPAKLLTITG